MARPKAGEVNKSEMARTIMRENPRMKVPAVVEQMEAKGVTITPNQVYFIRGQMKGRRSKKKRERAVREATRTAPANPVQAVMRVRQLAESMGGMKQLKQLVDVLAG